MKRSLVAGLILGLLIAAAPVRGATPVPVLRFGTFLPAPTINVRLGIVPWVDEVNAAAAGRLRIELFTGGAMGRNGKAQLALLKAGVLDITLLLPHYTPGQFPAAELFEIPLFEASAMETSLVFWRMYERGLLSGFDDIHPLALFVAAPSYLHMNFVYRRIDDLKGRKIRATTLFQARVLEDLGATPIGGITATQLAESLSRGLIDGAIFNWFAARRPMGITQVTTHHLEQPIAFTPAIIAINRARYEALPAAARRLLDDKAGPPFIRRLVGVMQRYSDRSIAESRGDPGRVFVAPDAEEKARWQAAFARQLDRWRARTPGSAALLAAYREILSDIRAQSAAASGDAGS